MVCPITYGDHNN